jgi:hypothetical protein
MKKPVPVFFAALTTAVLLAAGSPAVAQPKSPPEVQSVVPSSNIVLAKGDSTWITLKGTNFIYVSAVELVRADAAAKLSTVSPLQRALPPKVSLAGTRTGTSLGLLLEAPSSAPEGLYTLRLIAGGTAFDVPQAILKIGVVWGRPQITDYVPRQTPVGEVVAIRGKYLGDPAQLDKCQCLIRSGRAGETVREAVAETVSFSPTEWRVRVPGWAIYGHFKIVTPGGTSSAPSGFSFDPLYLHIFPPDLFRETGALGILRFQESQFIFANGTQNSAYFPSSAMRGMQFPEAYYFTFPPYEKPVNLVVGSTKYRIRLSGSDRRSITESLRTKSLDMAVEGTALKVTAAFESEGIEFVGEYETQDILSGKIYWKKFLNINIDNLNISVALTPYFLTASQIVIQKAEATSSFNPGFVVLDFNISVDQTPIKDYIKRELEASLRNYFLSEYFRSAFLPILGGHVQTLFEGARIYFIDVYAASAGGMKLVGTTRLVR